MAENRMVVDVPIAALRDDDQSPCDRVDTGLLGMPRRDSLMEDTMNLNKDDADYQQLKPVQSQS